MKKLMLSVMMIMSMILFLAPLAQAQSQTEMIYEGNGYFYAFVAGSDGVVKLQSSMDTPYSTRDDVLTIGGTSYMGMQYANSLTVDRLMIVNDGTAEFEQSYFDGSGDLVGYFGTFLSADEMGILATSGSFAGALADTNFFINQYAGKFNPHFTSTEVITAGLVPEGLGSSQMSVALYDDWVYLPSASIFNYWQDSWMSGVLTTGYVTLQLTEDDGLLVDISSTWTVPFIHIEIYTEILK